MIAGQTFRELKPHLKVFKPPKRMLEIARIQEDTNDQVQVAYSSQQQLQLVPTFKDVKTKAKIRQNILEEDTYIDVSMKG